MYLLRNKSKKRRIIAVITIVLVSIGNISYSHSGRTDSSGGHHDYKNKSGLGSYHYHHGYGPHLHTNGCPYEGGGSSSNSSSSGSYVSSEETAKRDAEAKARQEEKNKAYAKNEGHNKGYEDGYSKIERVTSTYTGSYEENYSNGYNEGYEKGLKKIENESKDATEKGYNLGIIGEELANPYSNEILVNSFEDGYNKGFEEFRVKKIAEYKEKGRVDGAEDKPMMEFKDGLIEDFKTAYIEGYNKSQKVIEKEYSDKGFQEAIKKEKSEEKSIDNEKHAKWYKDGYDNGKKRLEKELEIAYNRGLEGKEFEVESVMLGAKEYLKEEYNRGKEEAKTNGKIGVSVIGASAAGIVLYRRNKKKKRNRY